MQAGPPEGAPLGRNPAPRPLSARAKALAVYAFMLDNGWIAAPEVGRLAPA